MKLIVTAFMTLDGIIEAPGFDEHRSGRNAWALRIQNDEDEVYNLARRCPPTPSCSAVGRGRSGRRSGRRPAAATSR